LSELFELRQDSGEPNLYSSGRSKRGLVKEPAEILNNRPARTQRALTYFAREIAATRFDDGSRDIYLT